MFNNADLNTTFTINPKGILQIDNAKLVYKNFSGEASQYNREGDRNFSVVIPTMDIAKDLEEEGWNVKYKPSRNEDDDTPFITLPIKIQFNERGPKVYLKTGNTSNVLNEDSIDILDKIDILRVDLDVRPYRWEVNGKTGTKAYLQAISVEQDIDRFEARYSSNDAD